MQGLCIYSACDINVIISLYTAQSKFSNSAKEKNNNCALSGQIKLVVQQAIVQAFHLYLPLKIGVFNL